MIYLASDHRGFYLKEKIKHLLEKKNLKFQDLGNFKLDPNDDYPLFVKQVAQKISQNPQARGIVLCGSGIGASIVANKYKNVRAGICWRKEIVIQARNDDDINIMVLPADYIVEEELEPLINYFLTTNFSNLPRHRRRLEEIKEIENENYSCY